MASHSRRQETAAAATVISATAEFIGGIVDLIQEPTVGAQQMRLLLALYVHGTLNQIDLPRHTGVEKSANSRNIALLGEGQWVTNRTSGDKNHEPGMGLVEAYDEPTDRRFKMVRLTPKGRALLEQVAARVAPHFTV